MSDGATGESEQVPIPEDGGEVRAAQDKKQAGGEESEAREGSKGAMSWPGEGWRDAYHAQLTAPLIRRCVVAATRYARWIAEHGGTGGELRARELVQDALWDTRLGKLAWHPDDKSLESHIVDVIHWRARDELRRRQSSRTVWFSDAFGQNQDQDQDQDQEESPALAEETTIWDLAALEEEDARKSRLLAELRAQLFAKRDYDALKIVDAHHQGAHLKADILTLAGLSSSRYQRARARLCRVASQMNRNRDAFSEETAL